MKRTGLLFLLMGAAMAVQGAEPKAPERFVQVTGQGEIKVEPDEVLLNFQVETFGRDLKEVQRENANRTAAVMDTIKKFNVPSKDIQTGYAQISPRYDFNNGKRKFREYYSVKSFNLKLRDIGNYGAVLNALMDAGVESVGGVQFASSKLKQLEAEARKLAVLDARARAEALAVPLGAKVGKPISISDNEMGPVMPVRRMQAKMGMMADAAAMPEDSVAGGEITVKAQVSVQFDLQ